MNKNDIFLINEKASYLDQQGLTFSMLQKGITQIFFGFELVHHKNGIHLQFQAPIAVRVCYRLRSLSKRFDSPSLKLLSCGQQCMEHVWCTCTNYKMPSKKDGKGTCELKKHADTSLVMQRKQQVL